MSAPAARRPAEVPDLRGHLADLWVPGHLFATSAAAALASRTPAEIPDPVAWAAWEHETLQKASLWWVGADMVDLLLASAFGLPDDIAFAEVQELTPYGLVVLEKPWMGQDAETADRGVHVDALVWGPSSLPGSVRASASRVPCLSVSAYRRLEHGDGYDDLMARGWTWAPLGRSDWPLEDRIGEAPWPMKPQTRASFIEDRKVIVALWTLLHQEGIASRVEHRPPRAVTRRAERAGVPRPLSTVQVVTLRKVRRIGEAEPTGRKVEHDHRWLVKGFWRWQPVGKGRAERRLTYVRPHVRGPEDKPLHVPERVNAWTR